jgi:Flp pilus assembly pilin Flp
MGQALIRVYVRAQDARGQTASEYMGILLIVAVIVAGAYKSGIVDGVADRLSDIVTAIGGGKKP